MRQSRQPPIDHSNVPKRSQRSEIYSYIYGDVYRADREPRAAREWSAGQTSAKLCTTTSAGGGAGTSSSNQSAGDSASIQIHQPPYRHVS